MKKYTNKELLKVLRWQITELENENLKLSILVKRYGKEILDLEENIRKGKG